jgi:hypothetical protein
MFRSEHATLPTINRDVRRMFEQFLSENQTRSFAPARPEDREMLFRQFLEWQKKQPVGR